MVRVTESKNKELKDLAESQGGEQNFGHFLKEYVLPERSNQDSYFQESCQTNLERMEGYCQNMMKLEE